VKNRYGEIASAGQTSARGGGRRISSLTLTIRGTISGENLTIFEGLK
jgi:hypothetical protein